MSRIQRNHSQSPRWQVAGRFRSPSSNSASPPWSGRRLSVVQVSSAVRGELQ